MQFLKFKAQEDAYTEVSKSCGFVLTISATSSLVEHNFSTLKRIKNVVINSTVQERFSQVTLLFIENKLVPLLKISPHAPARSVLQTQRKVVVCSLYHNTSYS